MAEALATHVLNNSPTLVVCHTVWKCIGPTQSLVENRIMEKQRINCAWKDILKNYFCTKANLLVTKWYVKSVIEYSFNLFRAVAELRYGPLNETCQFLRGMDVLGVFHIKRTFRELLFWWLCRKNHFLDPFVRPTYLSYTCIPLV